MVMSAKQIQAVADAVAMWRMQEYITIAFFCLYVYYVLTTLAEEVSIVLPQRWSRGKMLYLVIRYWLLVYISLQYTRDYRNYSSISPNACKAILVVYEAIRNIGVLACDLSLALCLGALLQAKRLYLLAAVILTCGIPFVNAVVGLVSRIQYPAKPVSRLDIELGYPCYLPSTKQWSEQSILYVGRDIRSYMNLVATTLLVLLGVVTLVCRYKGQSGRLVQVIRRDGSIHYLALLAIRMGAAITRTPAVISVSEVDSIPMVMVMSSTNQVMMSILAQRLLINMRKVDYMGSEPIASKLLFAPPPPGSEDDLDGDFDSFEMNPEPSGSHDRGEASKGPEEGETINNV